MTRILFFLLILLPGWASAAPDAKLWPHWHSHTPDSQQKLDHTPWDRFLHTYLNHTRQPHLLDYAAVSKADHAALKAYLQQLQSLRPQTLDRAEQMAYWINLYNAATVDLVLEHWPVKSITRIKSGFFSFGPWDRELLRIDGQKLSLNDIEHRILRPIFRDPRIHYAVNCASIGCPDLAPRAYQANTLDAMLDEAARGYVNHPRGVRIEDERLIVSSIYDWFAEDFGDSEAALMAHLKMYARAELKQALNRHTGPDDYEYDWAINAP